MALFITHYDICFTGGEPTLVLPHSRVIRSQWSNESGAFEHVDRRLGFRPLPGLPPSVSLSLHTHTPPASSCRTPRSRTHFWHMWSKFSFWCHILPCWKRRTAGIFPPRNMCDVGQEENKEMCRVEYTLIVSVVNYFSHQQVATARNVRSHIVSEFVP